MSLKCEQSVCLDNEVTNSIGVDKFHEVARGSLYTFEYDFDEELNHLYIYYATQKDIDNLIFPLNLKKISIKGDHVDTLIIPDGIENVFIGRVGLKFLYLPDSVKSLYCDNNLLKNLELPRNIQFVNAKENYIENISFREGDPLELEVLKLNNNSRLTKLDFIPPSCLEVIKIKKCSNLRYVNPQLISIANKYEEQPQYIL